MHGEQSRWWRRGGHASRIPVRLPLAAGLATACAWCFAASLVLASASTVTLNAAEHTVTLAVNAAQSAALRQIAQGQPGALPGDPASYRSAVLVLDDVSLTADGAKGGYFYKIYLASAAGAHPSEQTLAGTLGPFEIAAVRQRGSVALRYMLGEPLAALRTQRMLPLLVSFRRAGGAGADGPLIHIGSMKLELDTEAGG